MIFLLVFWKSEVILLWQPTSLNSERLWQADSFKNKSCLYLSYAQCHSQVTHTFTFMKTSNVIVERKQDSWFLMILTFHLQNAV